MENQNNLENFHTSIKSVLPEEGTPIIKGYDFDKGINYDSLLDSFQTMGFQASNVYKAIQEINSMLHWRGNFDGEEKKCTIFLGYTSNMISCGMREIIKFLVKHKLIDCIVTTAGGVEEDFMKCLAPTYLGSFELNGRDLRMKGQNRIGNLIVPNKNYCEFEDWLTPILDKMVEEQNREKDPVHWSPAKMIERLGKEINNEDSVYYWAYKNNIPVFCPALTDGSIGDMIYFHSYSVEEGCKPLVLDIVQDIRALNSIAVFAKKSGMIILGGGVIKHHICNANLMRNGADFSVFINTGQEFDGSDSGARPDEALSWGKINIHANPVKVYSEASLVFPFIVAKTFAKYYEENLKGKEENKK